MLFNSRGLPWIQSSSWSSSWWFCYSLLWLSCFRGCDARRMSGSSVQADTHRQEAQRLAAQAESAQAAADEREAAARRERAEAELRAAEAQRDAETNMSEAERQRAEAQRLEEKAARLDPKHRDRDDGSTLRQGDDSAGTTSPGRREVPPADSQNR